MSNSPIGFSSGGFNRTHWQKKRPPQADPSAPTSAFNDDAWAVSSNFLIVCDGVSTIRTLGFDGFRLPKELTCLLSQQLANKKYQPSELKELLWTCARDCKEIGSTTCAIAVVDDHGVLHSLAYGDSGFTVLRQSNQGVRYKTVFRSTVMTVAFNRPFQINTRDRQSSSSNDEQSPNRQLFNWLAQLRAQLDQTPLETFQLTPGDIVVGFSDGFIDNVDTRTYERVINTIAWQGEASRAYTLKQSPKDNVTTATTVVTCDGPFTQYRQTVLPRVDPLILARALVKEALRLGCSRVWDERQDAKWVDGEFLTKGWPKKLDWQTDWAKSVEREINNNNLLPSGTVQRLRSLSNAHYNNNNNNHGSRVTAATITSPTVARLSSWNYSTSTHAFGGFQAHPPTLSRLNSTGTVINKTSGTCVDNTASSVPPPVVMGGKPDDTTVLVAYVMHTDDPRFLESPIMKSTNMGQSTCSSSQQQHQQLSSTSSLLVLNATPHDNNNINSNNTDVDHNDNKILGSPGSPRTLNRAAAPIIPLLPSRRRGSTGSSSTASHMVVPLTQHMAMGNCFLPLRRKHDGTPTVAHSTVTSLKNNEPQDSPQNSPSNLMNHSVTISYQDVQTAALELTASATMAQRLQSAASNATSASRSRSLGRRGSLNYHHLNNSRVASNNNNSTRFQQRHRQRQRGYSLESAISGSGNPTILSSSQPQQQQQIVIIEEAGEESVSSPATLLPASSLGMGPVMIGEGVGRRRRDTNFSKTSKYVMRPYQPQGDSCVSVDGVVIDDHRRRSLLSTAVPAVGDDDDEGVRDDLVDEGEDMIHTRPSIISPPTSRFVSPAEATKE